MRSGACDWNTLSGLRYWPQLLYPKSILHCYFNWALSMDTIATKCKGKKMKELLLLEKKIYTYIANLCQLQDSSNSWCEMSSFLDLICTWLSKVAVWSSLLVQLIKEHVKLRKFELQKYFEIGLSEYSAEMTIRYRYKYFFTTTLRVIQIKCVNICKENPHRLADRRLFSQVYEIFSLTLVIKNIDLKLPASRGSVWAPPCFRLKPRPFRVCIGRYS